jgi:hypothetical protein
VHQREDEALRISLLCHEKGSYRLRILAKDSEVGFGGFKLAVEYDIKAKKARRNVAAEAIRRSKAIQSKVSGKEAEAEKEKVDTTPACYPECYPILFQPSMALYSPMTGILRVGGKYQLRLRARGVYAVSVAFHGLWMPMARDKKNRDLFVGELVVTRVGKAHMAVKTAKEMPFEYAVTYQCQVVQPPEDDE